MNDPSIERLAERVKREAATFEYPPTPPIAVEVRRQTAPRQRRVRPARAWAAAVALILVLCLVAALAIKPVRAALLRVLQIGAIEINLLEEPPDSPGAHLPVSITNLGEQVSLTEAADFVSLPEPAFPPALGAADMIFSQNLFAAVPVITFLWLNSAERPLITLTLIEIPNFGVKWASGEQVEQTTVSGRPAIWIEGPHLFDLVEGGIDQQAVPATNVLIWTRDGLTYRLEGELTVDAARHIAESWK